MGYKEGLKSWPFWIAVIIIFVINYIQDYVDICNRIGCVFSIGFLLGHLVGAIILISIIWSIISFIRFLINKIRKR